MTTVVKDAANSIERANEISKKLLKTITSEILSNETENDPAEQIFLIVHTIVSFALNMCLILEGYGKTYDIPNLDANEIKNWIVKILDEYLKLHEKNK